MEIHLKNNVIEVESIQNNSVYSTDHFINNIMEIQNDNYCSNVDQSDIEDNFILNAGTSQATTNNSLNLIIS